MRTCPQCSASYDDALLHCPEDGAGLTDPEDGMIGHTVGSYRIVRPLGRGGMGAVYLAEHPVIGSKVAIKFLHQQFSNDKRIVERFFNEARAVNIIGHDNILRILDLDSTADNQHYFVMEFLQGFSLQSMVDRAKPIGLEVTGPILLQCCEALQAAHDKGIVHRDLKPENIYLVAHRGRRNFVKLVDFGIAKLTDGGKGESGQTQTGMVMGTPAYMSPEQAGGLTQKIDGRSDIYSLGVVMYQLATGRLPFQGESFGELLIGHLQLPPPLPRSIERSVPAQFEQILLKTLAKKQEDRYQSMSELREALHGCLDELHVSAELPLDDGLGQPLPQASGSRTLIRPSSQPPVREAERTRRAAEATLARRSQLPLVAAIVSVALLLGGGAAAFAYRATLEEERTRLEARLAKRAALHEREQKQRLAQEQAEVEERQKRDEERQKEEDRVRREAMLSIAPVSLSVVSDPLGAQVTAHWPGKSVKGVTPFSVQVPPNSRISLEFRRENYLPLRLEQQMGSEARMITGRLNPAAVEQGDIIELENFGEETK